MQSTLPVKILNNADFSFDGKELEFVFYHSEEVLCYLYRNHAQIANRIRDIICLASEMCITSIDGPAFTS